MFALEPLCAACGQPVATPLSGCVCRACWDALPRIMPPRCRRCGAPRAAHGPACDQCDPRWQVISSTIALGVHDGPLREALHALKYGRRTSIARAIGHQLRDAAHDILYDADAVVPVPLHPWRAWWRGFNQATLLARTLDVTVVDALSRRRATRRQAALARDDRWANLHAVIAVTPRARRDLRGKTLVLVDDVVTTGATVTACARALREAGAREVRVATAARAVRRSSR